MLLEIYKDWAPWIRKVIEVCDDDAIYHRPLYMLPIGHRWDHVPGVTLVGDAAHLMTPFAGAGANLAMLDGLELGLALAEAIGGGASTAEREAAIARWEEKMFTESTTWAKKTYENLHLFLSPDAPASTIEGIKSIMQDARREGAEGA